MSFDQVVKDILRPRWWGYAVWPTGDGAWGWRVTYKGGAVLAEGVRPSEKKARSAARQAIGKEAKR